MEPVIFHVACLLLILSVFANGQSDYSKAEYPDAPAAYPPRKKSDSTLQSNDYTDYNPPMGFNGNNPQAGFNDHNNNPGGVNGFHNPGGFNGFGNPAGYNPPAGSTDYNAPAGSNDYNAPAGPTDYNAPAGPTVYNAPAGPTGYNAPAGPTGYNAPAGSTGYNPPARSSNVRNHPAEPGRHHSVPKSNGKTSAAPSSRSSTHKHSQPKRTVASTHSKPRWFDVTGHMIVCLFNNEHYWRRGLRPNMIDASLCDILNYEFAMLDPKTYEMIPGEPDLDCVEDMYTEAIDLKKKNPRMKVYLSLGGWDDSTKKYSEMAADPDKRMNFVVKAVEFLRKHEFDGLDVAWEYPNCWQGALGVNPDDKPNFVLLLQELRQECDKYGLGLSMSAGPIKREIEAAYDVPAIVPLVDHINVMTYDMHGPWEPVTGHHTQFNEMFGDKDPYCNVKAAMNFWVQKGAPKKKLNMGIAYYAKTYRMMSPDRCQMGVPAIGIGEPGPVSQNGGFMLYSEMCQLLNAGNWTEYRHNKAGFYACSGDQFACYDPPMMVVAKARWVVMQGFGGLLLKDLSGDDFDGKCFNLPFPLTKMCRLEMVQQIHGKRRKAG